MLINIQQLKNYKKDIKNYFNVRSEGLIKKFFTLGNRMQII